jgi:hypothetical protein
MLRSIVCCTVMGLVTACASAPRQTKGMTLAQVDMSTDELRQRVYEIGTQAEGAIIDAVAKIHVSTRDLGTRRAAMYWALAAVPAVQEATLRPEPLVAVIDLWALAIQTESWARDGPGRAGLGEGWSVVNQAARDMATRCEQLDQLLLGSRSAAKHPETRAAIERWAAQNPITSSTFERPSASVAWSGAFAEDQRSALASFVVNTDQRLDVLGQRVAMLNRNMMTRMRWTLELLLQDSLGKESVTAVLDKAVHDMEVQRGALLADMDRERAAIFAQISRERTAIGAQLSGLVADTDARVNALVSQTDAKVNALVVQTDARARAVIDHLLVGAGLVGALLILLAAIATWAVRRSTPRPPGRADAAALRSRAAT